MPAKAKKPSAGARIKSAGKTLVWATFSEEEKQKIRTAAAFQGQPMSQFLREQGLTAAAKILEKMRFAG